MAIFKKEHLAQAAQDAASPSSRQTVMIVDDRDANVSVMAGVLRPHFNIIEALDGHEALRLIEGLESPASLACVISDHRMPKMTGVELFERVAALLPTTRRILVTGFMDMDALADAINKAAVFKFVAKPFDATDFLLNVRCAVAAYEAERLTADYHRELESRAGEPDGKGAELLARASAARAALAEAGAALQALNSAA